MYPKLKVSDLNVTLFSCKGRYTLNLSADAVDIEHICFLGVKRGNGPVTSPNWVRVDRRLRAFVHVWLVTKETVMSIRICNEKASQWRISLTSDVEQF
jgi:hypothetical protein